MGSVSSRMGYILYLLLGASSNIAGAFGITSGPVSPGDSRANGFSIGGNFAPTGAIANGAMHYSVDYRLQRSFPAPRSSYPPRFMSPPNVWGAGGTRGPVKQPKPVANSELPRVETELSQPNPYIHQSVVYTVRIVSRQDVKTLDLELPLTDDAVIKPLEGPLTHARKREGGWPEVVNEYRFALTPIKNGEVTIPPIQIKGTLAAPRSPYNATFYYAETRGHDQAFQVSTGDPIVLKVKQAAADVQPWLPLEAFQIRGQLTPEAANEIGKPLSLIIELAAVGATGEQLPSIESQLKSEKFRIYLESSHTQLETSGDPTTLFGRRIETYTLVPLEGGDMKIPTLQISWWNTRTEKLENSTLTFKAPWIFGSAENTDAFVSEPLFPWTDLSAAIWIPLLLIGVVILGLWGWVLKRAKWPAMRKPLASFGRIPQPIRARLTTTATHMRRLFSPVQLWQNLRYRLVMIMPASMKLWFCSRCIGQEGDPAEWCQMFKFLACKHLEVSHETPLQGIADSIIEAHPGANPAQIHTLIRELDGAMYGGKSLDFKVWKAAFRKELRPHLFRRRRQFTSSGGGLPKLNPTV